MTSLSQTCGTESLHLSGFTSFDDATASTTKSFMKTCVFTPAHETGILVAHIIPYAGSHDTRLGRESSWPLVPSGTHSFFRPLRVKGFFVPGPVERRCCFP